MERRRSSRRQGRRFRRPWLKKCKEYIRTFIAFMFSNVGIIGLVIGYTIAGSFIFQFLERGRKIEVHVNAIGNRTYFARRLWNLTMELNSNVKLLEEDYREAVAEELVQFQKIFVNLTRKGYDGSDDVLGEKTWSFAGAFLFSLTVITTIAEPQPGCSGINESRNTRKVTPRRSVNDSPYTSEEEPFPHSESEYSPQSTSSGSSNVSNNSLVKKRKQAVTKKLFFDDVLKETLNAVPAPTSNHFFENESQSKSSSPKEIIEEIIISNPKPKKKVFSKIEKKARKSVSDPDKWKRRAAAIAREMGESYISQKGKTIASKTINEGTLCTTKCRKKCSNNITSEIRRKIFARFYKLDVNGKNMFLFKSMTARSPKRPQKIANRRHKVVSYKYFLEIDKKTYFICKKAFCSIFQIGKKKVEYLQKKNRSCEPAPTPDKRGKHTNRPNKVSDDARKYIKEHIGSFPAELSHYSRNINPHKKYLSPTLNISKMYQLYVELCNENEKPAAYFVKYCTYAKIFSTEFNLSFGTPRSDTCTTCDSGQSNEQHKINYEAAFSCQREDRNIAKTNPEICYITMDLQQTLPLPKLTTSKAFYLRQMWMYNLGIHSITKDQERANFFTWTEDVANRGSVEICSSLLTFLEYEFLLQEKNISHLVIWTDSCAGQNKNFLIICLYQYLILKGIVKEIDHKFPEVGHSFLDSDRDFGRIEKNLRKHDTIYLPDEYRTIITKSSKMNHVTDMSIHFRNFEHLAEDLNLINRKKNLQNETVHFRDGIKWIKVEEYGSYLYKESYDPNTPFKKVNIIKNARLTRPKNVEIQRIGRKYGKLAPLKIENLKTQVPFVKEPCRWYYDQIIRNQENN